MAKREKILVKTILEKEIKERLLKIRHGAFITPHLHWFLQLLGCDKCYGKGYGTSITQASGRIGKRGEMKTWRLPMMKFCRCERGKQLAEAIKHDKNNPY